MKKKLLHNLQDFDKFKQEQIEEYKNCYSPAVNSTKSIETPKSFPVIVVYDDFNDSDDGMYFFYEFVYLLEFKN